MTTPYATAAQFRGQMPLVQASAELDSQIDEKLAVATRIVENELGFAFAGFAAEASERHFSSNGGVLLVLPYFEPGTLVSVGVMDGATGAVADFASTDYEAEADNHRALFRLWGHTWPKARYKAVAKWGYGAAPEEIVEIVLELTAHLWLSKQRGMTGESVGAEGGGAINPPRLLTWGMRDVITAVRRKYAGWGIA